VGLERIVGLELWKMKPTGKKSEESKEKGNETHFAFVEGHWVCVRACVVGAGTAKRE
jgi:hypothetical protein